MQSEVYAIPAVSIDNGETHIFEELYSLARSHINNSRVYEYILQGEFPDYIKQVFLVTANRELRDDEWPKHVRWAGDICYKVNSETPKEDNQRAISDKALWVRVKDSQIFNIERAIIAHVRFLDESDGAEFPLYGVSEHHQIFHGKWLKTSCGKNVLLAPRGNNTHYVVDVWLEGYLIGYIELILNNVDVFKIRCANNIKKFDQLDFLQFEDALNVLVVTNI